MAKDNNEIIIYQGEDGETRIEVKFTGETVWLSQQQLCELYDTSKANVSEHIKHIFEDGELDEKSVVRKFRTTATDGKSYMTTFYNLDMIIALLDFAERQAEKEQPMTMNDWANYLDRILTSTGEQLLLDGGRVSHQEAMDHATTEYRKYKQRTLSDVEQDYLNAIKAISDKSKKGGKK